TVAIVGIIAFTTLSFAGPPTSGVSTPRPPRQGLGRGEIKPHGPSCGQRIHNSRGHKDVLDKGRSTSNWPIWCRY
ncbi:hypothetical protein, partial [Desulfolutivibrio sp.]|uniref:hypothetical protein n=1 Tax=Desulfolutivibrio sp. TaxID=2773296 RepID=UPI002F96D15F